MEWEPKKEEVSLDEQVTLSKKLSDAVDAANDFIKRFGSFDDFADVHQHVGGNREKFDKLSFRLKKIEKRTKRGYNSRTVNIWNIMIGGLRNNE